jgi:serine/threonine-protein kinase
MLAGRYRLDHQIAVGGMGEVWAATDSVLDRVVAVKLLRSDVQIDNVLQRFRAEARHAASLTHPGIARVYDYGEEVLDAPVAYLVMELVDGRPVPAGTGHPPLPADVVVDLLIQAADALGAAHDHGIVHRDVKPGNLLLATGGVVKVTDFGIAHAIDAPCVTDDGKVAGTARYMSPEQATGSPVAASSDVYSLAVVGYQLLTGAVPFTGAPAAVALAHVRALPPPLPPTVPIGLRSVIERSLAKDPAQRPQDGHALAAELRAVHVAPAADPADGGPASVAGQPDLAAPTRLDVTQVWPRQPELPVAPPAAGALVPARPWRGRRNRRRVGAAAIALVATAVVGLGARAEAGADVNGHMSTVDVLPTTTLPTSTSAAPMATEVAVTTAMATQPAPAPSPVTTAAAAKPHGKGNDKGGNGKGKGGG